MAAPAEPAATNESEREKNAADPETAPPRDENVSPRRTATETPSLERPDDSNDESPRRSRVPTPVSPSRSPERHSDALDQQSPGSLADAADPASVDPASAATATVDCPPGFVGRVIGKGGETIKGLQAQSGAHITIDQNFPEGVPRKIFISGSRGCVSIAARLVEELLRGVSGPLGGGVGPGQAQSSVRCPKEMVGRVIGRGGETVKGLQAATGARIQIDQSAAPCVVTITGNPRCVDAASRAVADVVRGGSTATYGAANRRREAHMSMSMAAMYGGPIPMRGAVRGRGRTDADAGAGVDVGVGPHYARGALYGEYEYPPGLGEYSREYAARGAHMEMAQLEHQFAAMGYGHPGGLMGVPMGPGHPGVRFGAPPYGNPNGFPYGAPDAYGGYGGDPGAYPPHAGSEMSAMYAAQMMQAHMMPPGQTRGGWIGAARGRSGPSARGPAAADGASGADGADAPRRLGVPRADGAVPAVPARRAGGARD